MPRIADGAVLGPAGRRGQAHSNDADAVGSVVEEIHRVGGRIRRDLHSGSFSAEDRQTLAAILSRLEHDLRTRQTQDHSTNTAEATPVNRAAETLDAAWGPAVSAEHAAAAAEDMEAIRFAERRALADKSLTRAQVAELLAVSAPAITGRLEAGQLLGFKVRGRWAIPRWQLDADSATGLLPGLDRLSAAFPGGLVALSRWVCAPHPDLAGRTPRDAMAAGDVDDVLAIAEAITATGW